MSDLQIFNESLSPVNKNKVSHKLNLITPLTTKHHMQDSVELPNLNRSTESPLNA